MSKLDLVPTDLVTRRLMVDVLTKMFKNSTAIKRAAATSEFPRPDEATAGTQSVQTDMHLDSTTVIVSGQNNKKARVAPVIQRSSKR